MAAWTIDQSANQRNQQQPSITLPPCNCVMNTTLFDNFNALANGQFSDPYRRRQLGDHRQIYSDGMIFNVTKTANWHKARVFTGLCGAADA